MPFEYQPLERGEIRLITLQPIGDQVDATVPVHCKIEHIKLPVSATILDSPFKGVDYVWPEVNHPVNTGRIFKDPSTRSISFSNMFYSTSPRVEADQPGKTESAQKDYIKDEDHLP